MKSEGTVEHAHEPRTLSVVPRHPLHMIFSMSHEHKTPVDLLGVGAPGGSPERPCFPFELELALNTERR